MPNEKAAVGSSGFGEMGAGLNQNTNSPINLSKSGSECNSRFVPVFDADAITYLLNNLGLNGIRRELRNWNVERASLWEDSDHPEMQSRFMDADDFYWWDYRSALLLAWRIARTEEISNRPKPQPGQSTRIDVENLKTRIDILGVAKQYTHLRKAGRNYSGLCPFHSERTPSFIVNPHRQSWHCFGACNTGGDVVSLVMKAENTDFKGALTILGGAL